MTETRTVLTPPRYDGTRYEVEGSTPSRLVIVRMPQTTYSQKRGQHKVRPNDRMTVHLADPSEARLLTLCPGSILVDANDERVHARTACGSKPIARHYHDLDDTEIGYGPAVEPDIYDWCRKCFPNGPEGPR